MKYYVISFLLVILFWNIAYAKKITEGNVTYQCVPEKNCEDKLKEARTEIARLKKKLKEQKPATIEKTVYVDKIVKKEAKKNILSLYTHRDVLGSDATTTANGATARTDSGFIPGIMYQRVTDSGLVFGAGVNTNAHPVFDLGYSF